MSDIERAELSANQERALLALIAEPTKRRAAQACGISEAQIYRHLADETFQAEYQRRRQEAYRGALDSLRIGAETAAGVLRELVSDETISPVVRMGASSKLLQLSFKAQELADVEERISELERRIELAKL